MGKFFIAVVPVGLTENLELQRLVSKLKRTLKDRGQNVRWVPPDLWHITLHFLGQMDGAMSARLRARMEAWRPDVSAFQLRLQGMGAFPAAEEARVLWLGVATNQDLMDLQGGLRAELVAGGITPEEREFNPHLTLGRFRNLHHAGDLIALGGRKHFGDYAIRDVVLFESVLQGGIAKYSPVWRVPLLQPQAGP